MPRIKQCPPCATRSTPLHHIPLAFCHLGNGHTWTIPHDQRAGQIPPLHGGLLHQVDWSKDPHNNHSSKGLEVHMEENHLQVRHHDGQQETVHEKGREEFFKHLTSLVEHPQTNGQAEVANKVILGEAPECALGVLLHSLVYHTRNSTQINLQHRCYDTCGDWKTFTQ